MLAADGNHSVDSRYAFVANPESSLRIVDLLPQPYVAGVDWLPEMGPFRRDTRFQTLVARPGLMRYWQRYGALDAGDLKNDKFSCL